MIQIGLFPTVFIFAYLCSFILKHVSPPTPPKSPVSDVFQNLLVGKLDKLVANDHFSHLRNGT